MGTSTAPHATLHSLPPSFSPFSRSKPNQSNEHQSKPPSSSRRYLLSFTLNVSEIRPLTSIFFLLKLGRATFPAASPHTAPLDPSLSTNRRRFLHPQPSRFDQQHHCPACASSSPSQVLPHYRRGKPNRSKQPCTALLPAASFSLFSDRQRPDHLGFTRNHNHHALEQNDSNNKNPSLYSAQRRQQQLCEAPRSGRK